MNAAAITITPVDEEPACSELLALPGASLVVWGGPGLEPGSCGQTETLGASTMTWLGLLTALTRQLSAELELGSPRLLSLSFDARMLALAIDPDGAFMAVLAEDPAAVGLALSKLRQWLRLRSEERIDG